MKTSEVSIEDEKGAIWLSTNGGIAQWKSDEKRFLNYTWHQGIPRGDFMDGFRMQR